ncbi:hypothetical protein FB451DRAFT_1260659, partial [Mycena latifolia]
MKFSHLIYLAAVGAATLVTAAPAPGYTKVTITVEDGLGSEDNYHYLTNHVHEGGFTLEHSDRECDNNNECPSMCYRGK